ncbi:MAG: hypothetical protein JNM43_04325 [Planctomycetaceae bacterium]|nr:hypothetical protein [Planctomycetaceae bacterium]
MSPQRFLTLLTFSCLAVMISPTCVAQDPKITVTEIDAGLMLGSTRNNWSVRLGLQVEVENTREENLRLQSSQFSLLVDNQPASLLQDQSTFSQSALKKGDKGKGTCWFTIPVPASEPKLILQWGGSAEPKENNGDKAPAEKGSVQIDVNEVLRSLCKVNVNRTGPEQCLALVTINRNLDIPSTWILQDKLKQIAADGVERVIILPSNGANTNLFDEVATWLATMIEQPVGAPVPNSPLSRPNFSFKALALAGLTTGAPTSPFRSRRAIRQFRTDDEAIAELLTPVYRFIPVDQAIADLRNTKTGIRRAALAGAIDRLTETQAAAIMEQARSGSEDLQLEVASYLNLIPGTQAVDALKELSLKTDSKVAPVALTGLATSRDESAVKAMAEVWEAGSDRPILRSTAVLAMVRADDDRWTPLVASFVDTELKKAVAGESGTSPLEHFSEAIEFLRQRQHSDTLLRVRQQVAHVKAPAFQDVLIEYLNRINRTEDRELLRTVVSDRMKAAQISSPVRFAAMQIRDSSWTEPLLDEYRKVSETRSMDRVSLHAALLCASPEQLDALLKNRSSLPASARGELLTYLYSIEHPQWRTLAVEMVSTANNEASVAIQLLGQDASEESLQILRQRLTDFVQSLEGTPDASVEGQHHLQMLLAQLAAFVHPECRRQMNQMTRSSNDYIRERAVAQVENARRRSPAYRNLLEEYQFRKAGQIPEAMAALERGIKADPFLPEVWVRRASSRMHAGKFEESMADLEEAERLSPEDSEVLSMIALVRVRLGKIEDGLRAAEDLITQGPKDWTALYNGACTYARATENASVSAEDKTRYADRAIVLLNLTADQKFNDHEHLVVDEDLLSLHNHPQWQAVVDRAKANAAAAGK